VLLAAGRDWTTLTAEERQPRQGDVPLCRAKPPQLEVKGTGSVTRVESQGGSNLAATRAQILTAIDIRRQLLGFGWRDGFLNGFLFSVPWRPQPFGKFRSSGDSSGLDGGTGSLTGSSSLFRGDLYSVATPNRSARS
jgi:hypothetical protein